MRRRHLLGPLPALLALALLLAPSPRGVAQAHRRPTRAEVHQIELEAKVSFNEASDSYHDLAMIHQATEAKGATAQERTAWLARHSRCVSRARFTQQEAEHRAGNCRWTRNLRPNGARPTGWDRALHGRWSWVRRRWLQHIRRTHDLVMGIDRYRPCSETPDTWDGVRYGRACVERGEDCPYERREGLDRPNHRSRRRVLECRVPYVRSAAAEGLHNFAVSWHARSGPAS